MRPVRRIVLVVGLALGLVLGLAGPASADTYNCSYGCAGRVTFTSYGEHLRIYDQVADGHSVVVWNRRSDLGSTWYTGWNPNGAGTMVDYDLSMPDGHSIDYYVCLGEYGSRTTLWATCGGIVTDRA